MKISYSNRNCSREKRKIPDFPILFYSFKRQYKNPNNDMLNTRRPINISL